MTADDVTDAMVKALDECLVRTNKGTLMFAEKALAAALTAMPDDLLRKRVAERGCVMVRRELLDDLRDDALQSAIANEHFKCHPTKDSRYAEPLARAIQVAAMLAASDPRQQAQDICGNCETAMPEGCGGIFKKQPECRLHQQAQDEKERP